MRILSLPGGLLRAVLIPVAWATTAIIAAGGPSEVSGIADSFASFRFHVAALALVLSGLLFLLSARRTALLSAVTGGVGMLMLGAATPWTGVGPVADPGTGLRLLTLNLNYRNPEIDKVAAYIDAVSPDVVTLQEVSPRTRAVLALLAEAYPGNVICRFNLVGDVAVLTRLPVAGRGCRPRQGLAWMRLGLDGREVGVASLHLSWPWPFPQAKQIGELADMFRALPKPTVIAGDFNAAPWTAAVARVALLSDTRVVPGLRRTFTWNRSWLGQALALPLDHVLVGDGVAASAIQAGPMIGSDHRPVVADLVVSKR